MGDKLTPPTVEDSRIAIKSGEQLLCDDSATRANLGTVHEFSLTPIPLSIQKDAWRKSDINISNSIVFSTLRLLQLADALLILLTHFNARRHAVTKAVTSVHEWALEKYGPLMTYSQVAEMLSRTTNGLRVTMARRESEASRMLSDAKLTIGRRVYFRTDQVTRLIGAQPVGAVGRGRHV